MLIMYGIVFVLFYKASKWCVLRGASKIGWFRVCISFVFPPLIVFVLLWEFSRDKLKLDPPRRVGVFIVFLFICVIISDLAFMPLMSIQNPLIVKVIGYAVLFWAPSLQLIGKLLHTYKVVRMKEKPL